MPVSSRRRHRRALLLSSLLASVSGIHAAQTVLPQPGQPAYPGTPLQFEIVGDSFVSAQQMFLGRPNKVYILDKTENNPHTINGHPAWVSEYTLDTDVTRAMDVMSNTFCAGGNVLGNGTWINLGGNQGVTWGGNTAPSQNGGPPYDDMDGGRAIRFLDPCDDDSCEWMDDPALYMSTRRWYATLETVTDGSVIIIGGNQWGGYVNSEGQNNPTYEFWPSKGDPIGLNILTTTLPANLFPLTWLLPSGQLFIQTNWAAEIFDYHNNIEYALPNMPLAVRTYPASGGSTMLPLTPANNWTATMLFCGGSNLEPDQWTEDWNIAQYPADASCVKITPDVNTTWVIDDSLPEGRTMGNFIHLPNGKLFFVNGGNSGTAGYGNVSWAIGHSYADHPIKTPLLYDYLAPPGQRFTRDGLGSSTVSRLYHSSALLLPDGSVFVSGSNPNPDVITGPDVTYPTEYRTERFYPDYYNKPRPNPAGLLSQLFYGGPYFNVTLSNTDLSGDMSNLAKTSVVVIRPGFCTHAINMGQRSVTLNSTYTSNPDGTAALHVSQIPPNPAILAPGPAMIFVVVNGVPSVGQFIMVGSGNIEVQNPTTPADLPISSLLDTNSTNSTGSNNNTKNGAIEGRGVGMREVMVGLFAVLAGVMMP